MASENENEKRETPDDILAEMRREVGDGEDTYCGKRIIRRMDDVRVRQYCARIEAAWKREREELDKRISDLEAYAKLWTGRADELRLKCDEFYAKAKPVGNAAAMREALEFCLRIIGENGIRGNVFLGDIQEAHRAITAALSAPTRQCDVGTAEEQAQRYDKFCKKSSMSAFVASAYCAYECACKDCSCCEFAWAQMPYEAEEGGAE